MRDPLPPPDEMLAKPWPDFFVVMETDLARGTRAFMDAGYRYLLARPPREFFACPGLEPGDFAIRVITALVRDGCRRLRCYRDQGRPFLAWFRTAAVRIAIDIIRQEKAIHGPIVPIDLGDEGDNAIESIGTMVETAYEQDLARLILAAIDSFGAHHCRRLLRMRYVDDYSNQEISRKCPEGWSNVEVGNRFRRCRLRLMEKLKERGITPDLLR